MRHCLCNKVVIIIIIAAQKGANPDGYSDKTEDEDMNHFLVLIIAVPAVIIVVVVSVVIYSVCKKTRTQNSQKKRINQPVAPPVNQTHPNGGVGNHARPTSSSSSATPAHKDNKPRHYYTAVPVHQSSNMYNAAPLYNNHNAYLQHNPNLDYEYPLINSSGNNSSSLLPSTTATSTSPHHHQGDNLRDPMMTNYWDNVSEGSVSGGPPRNTTPIPVSSQHSSEGYIPNYTGYKPQYTVS